MRIYLHSLAAGYAALSLACGDAAAEPTDSAAPGGSDATEVALEAEVEVEVQPDDTLPPEVDSADTSLDVEAVVDPCEPNPCAAAPSGRCSVTLAGFTAYNSECEPVDGAASCTYPSTTLSCETGSLCVDGGCMPIAAYCDFPHGQTTSLARLWMPGDQSDVFDPATGEREDACCRDFDGDGFVDNAIGKTFRDLAPFIGPASEIAGPTVTRSAPIIDIHGLDDPNNDPEVWVYLYGGRPDGDATNPQSYSIAQRGFDPATNQPPGAGYGSIEDGVLRIVDGYNRIALGSVDEPLYIEIFDLQLEGKLRPSESGGYIIDGGDDPRGAKMSGLVRRETNLAAFNRHVLEFCTCTDFADLAEPVIDIASGTCKPAEERAPSCAEPDSLCEILTHPNYCSLIVAQFQPDIDTNGDGNADSLSVGFWTAYIPVTVSGIFQCP